MKRLVFLIMAVFLANMAKAVEISHLRQIGLPAKAVPAKLYFENIMTNTPRKMTDEDISKSALTGFENEFFFFVEPLPTAPDDMYACINVWMYDPAKDKVVKIFSQRDEECEELFVTGISWLFDKQSSFKDVVVEDTKQKIGVQEFTFLPVVILQAEVFTGFAHSPQLTMLVYPDTKKVIRLDNEMFVSVFYPLSNMLMMAEMDNAQEYILTTSTEMRVDRQDLKETEEYILFNKQYLTPTIHVYTARGKKVGSITLPEDEIDMIR